MLSKCFRTCLTEFLELKLLKFSRQVFNKVWFLGIGQSSLLFGTINILDCIILDGEGLPYTLQDVGRTPGLY